MDHIALWQEKTGVKTTNKDSLLLSYDGIMGRKQEVPVYPLVYFLILGNEVVYIGKSECGYSRIYRHFTDRKIDFTSVAIHRCEKDELNTLEKRYIRHYKPKHNITYKKKTSKGGAPISKFTTKNGRRIFRFKYREANAWRKAV